MNFFNLILRIKMVTETDRIVVCQLIEEAPIYIVKPFGIDVGCAIA